ncbi:chitin binding Peritrophin-A domain protein, partial [Ancylostoma caninum]
SGESSDFPPSEPASDGSAYAPVVEESWDSTPEPVEPENTTPVPMQLATFCENKTDGFYASGCSSEMIACVAGVGTSMLCPAHLIFDEEKQICEYPENVPCSATKQEDLGECEAEGTTAHGPCSNTFTNCVEGKAYSLACDDGYVFSETHGTCTEASKVPECATTTTKPY